MPDFKYYNHLGFHNPYYHIEDGQLVIAAELSGILLPKNKDWTLDYTSLVQILSTGYAFGDRTLIKEIKKTPWMARPNLNNSGWDFFKAPRHQENIETPNAITDKFYSLLKAELKEYIGNHKTIGILLTGGMDSRIVAGILKNLQDESMPDLKVIAYTWGSEDSRDVVYANRIANIFGWEWKHIKVDSAQMLKNYYQTIDLGCEFTPIHLHAMSKVASENNLDCVLAGSFGDSIGRGEYSGVKVKNLKPLSNKIKNLGGVLRDDAITIAIRDIEKDIQEYHALFPETKEYQLYEQDLQIHYMRRMLNPCMNVINKKIPLYQMFSSPSVFGFIWSLHPDLRNDSLYEEIINKFFPELIDIPWARTGKKYPQTEGEPMDSFKKRHHDYGKMIRDEFIELIEQNFLEHRELAKTIYNWRNIWQLIRNCKRRPISNSFIYEEKLLWLASVLEFIKTNNLVVELPQKHSVNLLTSIKEDIYYKAKWFYKTKLPR